MRNKRYQRLFKNDNGKKFGDFIEEIIARICGFVRGPEGCDRQFQKFRIECKAMRSVMPMEDKINSGTSINEMLDRIEENTMEKRALLSLQESPFYGVNPSTGQIVYLGDDCFCQQTKPANFDYLVATNVFLDMMRVYIIPSVDINPRVGRGGSKLSMAPQHGNDREGVLSLSKVINYHAFDIDEPITRLGKLQVDISPFVAKRPRRRT